MKWWRYRFYPHLFVFGESRSTVLLGKRKSEPTHENPVGPACDAMNHADNSIIDCLKRIKKHQLGEQCGLQVFTSLAVTQLHGRRDGVQFIFAYYPAMYLGGSIISSEEFCDHVWWPTGSVLPDTASDGLFETSRQLDIVLRTADPQAGIDI